MKDPSSEDRLPTLGYCHSGPDPPAPEEEDAATIPRTPSAPPSFGVDGGEQPRIPGYEILGRLGQGGMGVVYRARHLGLKRQAALKILRPCRTEIDLARFRREAEVAARLQHPHIVQVYEVGGWRDGESAVEQPYIAFELINGGGLNDLLRESVLPPQQAAQLLETLARTMQTVHDQGVVHRDLKPANVLLAVSSAACGLAGSDVPAKPQAATAKPQAARQALHVFTPKITDFGLACLLEEEDGLTRTGQLLGTPGYMAPEQAHGRQKQVGPAADIHALGAILYECLTGRPPFKGASLHETLALVCEQEPVPIRRQRPDVPRDLETICLKCLHKDPAKRYATAGELADDLHRFGQGRPILARPVSRLARGWRWCRRSPVLAALSLACVILAATLLCGAGWYASRLAAAHAAVQTAAAEVDEAREVAATQEYYALLHANRERTIRREPGWPAAGLADLHRAAGLPTRAIDRRELRGEAARCLAGVDLRPVRKICAGVTASRIAFHPREPLLALAEAKGWLFCTVVLVDRETGKVVRSLSLPSSKCWCGDRLVQDGVTALAFSPDGRWLLAGSRTGALHRWDLALPSSRSTSWKAHTTAVEDLMFSTAGDALFSAGPSIKRWSVHDGWKQTHRLAVSGRMTAGTASGALLVCDHHQVHCLNQANLEPIHPPTATPGRRMRFCGRGPVVLADRSSLCLLDPVAGRITQTLRRPGSEEAHEGDVDDVAVSPDGLALASFSNQTRHVRLWETVSGRLTADLPVVEGVAQIAFAPTGSTLAVLTGREVHLHEVRRFDEQTFRALHAWPVLACTWLGREGGLACLAGDRKQRQGQLSVWPSSGASIPQWQCETGLPITRVAVRLRADDSGKWLAWTEGDGLGILPVDRPGGRRTAGAEVESLAFAPAERGRPMLWVAGGLRVQAWTVSGFRPTLTWDNELGDMVTGLGNLWAVAPGRQRVLAGGRDGCLRLLDAGTGKLQGAWRMCSSGIRSVALSADEQLALVGTWKGGVRLVRLSSGEKIPLPARHRDRVEAVAFLGQGLFASGSADRTVRLYRFDGQSVSEWLTLRLRGAVESLSASPDGERLAVLLAGERAVRIWDVKRLRERLTRMGLEEEPGGRYKR